MKESIAAYELKERVERYDIEMEIMHPNRSKMCDIAIEFLPFNNTDQIRALDLGAGTGFFTKKFLESFTKAHVIALDGAASMIELAKARLGSLCTSIDFVVADFKNLDQAFTNKAMFDVIFCSFALHHLIYKEKEQAMKAILGHLKPGGWFLNADNIIGETMEVEKRFQQLRVEGIVDRAKGNHDHFKNFTMTRRWLDKMEAFEKDNPLPLSEDIKILQDAGFRNVDVLWKEYREEVHCGQRD